MLDVSISSFSYTQKPVLGELTFSLKKGEHLAVLGESGCGKSTLLHLVYGLLHLEEGSISWKGNRLLGPKYNLVPGEEFIKLVAQEFNVMPYISVTENVATYLPRRDMEKDLVRVKELLEVVEMEAFANTMVKDLSGGQKQRVALAKALAKQPELLLLDEPFSHIDTFRKNKLRRRLFRFLKENEIACITATHDAEEALAFSDKLLILKDGDAVAYGRPEEVYTQLDTPYLAGFFGEVTVLKNKGANKEFLILLPHQLCLSERSTDYEVTVVHNFFKGSHFLIQAKLGAQEVFFNNFKPLSIGTSVFLEILK